MRRLQLALESPGMLCHKLEQLPMLPPESAALNLVSLFEALTIFWAARTRADQLLRLADLMQHVCFGRNSAAILAAPFQADRYAPPVQAARATGSTTIR